MRKVFYETKEGNFTNNFDFAIADGGIVRTILVDQPEDVYEPTPKRAEMLKAYGRVVTPLAPIPTYLR